MEEEVRGDKSGYMLMNKPSYERVPAWPDLVWVIFLMALFIAILLWASSFLAYAPLEEQAEWAKTPNPAKAPWYFIGLQELLVYFDPWIAGVMLPQQIIIGLMLIPYVDTSPEAQGCYCFSRRRFAVAYFTFGVAFWFVLILVGQFLRGPSWEVYYPVIDYDFGSHSWVREGVPLKEGKVVLKSMSLRAGATLLTAYAAVGMVLPVVVAKLFGGRKWAKPLNDYLKALGPVKYFLVQSHVLMMLGVVGKIFLRLVFNVKYIVETPWFKI